jgi:hypothetical protein
VRWREVFFSIFIFIYFWWCWNLNLGFMLYCLSQAASLRGTPIEKKKIETSQLMGLPLPRAQQEIMEGISEEKCDPELSLLTVTTCSP